MVRWTIAVFAVVMSMPGVAQDRCGTVPYMMGVEKESAPVFERWITQRTEDRRARTDARVSYTIPVVVHVIHKGEPVGTGSNVSDAQILSQIKVINDDFRRRNADSVNTPADFRSVAGKVNIEFVLARSDPDGQATNGIVRKNGVRNTWTINQDVQLKAISYWPAENYLNLWVTDLDAGLLGYAQFPVTPLPGLAGAPDNRLVDGVVVDYLAFGSIDDGTFNLAARFNKGRAATHEIGHFLGLRHIWGDDDGKCGGVGDYVSDTPDAGDNTSGCPTHPFASCTEKTMFQNYMDYTNDNCMNLFTVGQVSRIETVLTSSPRRASLLTSPGLLRPEEFTENIALVSIDRPSPIHCENVISPKLRVANKGKSVVTSMTVTYSINAAPAVARSVTGISISPGAEAQVEIPSIALSTGENILSFGVSLPNGVPDVQTTDNTISTRSFVSNARDIVPVRESFDGNWEAGWATVSPNGGMLWNDRATNYNRSICFQGFSNTNIGDQAWLASPVLDLSSLSYASVFFDLSHRNREGALDRLTIRASRDCGLTYPDVLLDRTGTSLSGTNAVTSWTPAQPSDWNRTFLNLTGYAGEKNVRLAFIASNGGGNNLYLDNFEFFVSDSPNPAVPQTRYAVYQNPGEFEGLFIAFNLASRQSVRVEVINSLGQPVMSTVFDDVLNQTVMLDPGAQSRGVYIVRLAIEGTVVSERVLLGD